MIYEGVVAIIGVPVTVTYASVLRSTLYHTVLDSKQGNQAEHGICIVDMLQKNSSCVLDCLKH